MASTSFAATISQDTQNGYVSLKSTGYTGQGQHFTDFPISTITSIQIYLNKTGSPTGTLYVRARKVSDDSIIGTLGSIDVSTISSGHNAYTFNTTPVFNSAVQDIRITAEYSGGDNSNSIETYYTDSNVLAGSIWSYYLSSWADYDLDFNFKNLTYYAPEVTSVSLSTYDSSLNKGQPLQTPDSMVIAGHGFTNATAVSLGTGVTITSFTVDSDTQITITKLWVSESASTGARTLTVTTSDYGDLVLPQAITITARDYYPITGKGWGWIWNSLTQPFAMRYNGTHDRTYIVWQGPKSTGAAGDPYITYYDHDEAALGNNPWSAHTKVAVNSATTGTSYDSTPSIMITDNGYILISYGSDGTGAAMKVIKSTNVEDITAWGDALNVDNAYYNTFVKRANGDIYLFYQYLSAPGETRKYAYKKTTDGGANWGSRVALIDFTDDGGQAGDQVFAYFTYDSVNDYIQAVFSHWDASQIGEYNYAQDLWHLTIHPDDKINDMAGGYDSTTALSYTNAISGTYKFQVIESGALNGTFNPTISIDSSGGVHILVPISTGNIAPFVQSYITWTGSAWTTPQSICEVWPLSIANLDIISSTNIDAYFTDANADMVKYNLNGSTWTKISTIIDSSEEPGHTAPKSQSPFVPLNRSNSFKLIFCQVDYTDYNNLKVYMVPTNTVYRSQMWIF